MENQERTLQGRDEEIAEDDIVAGDWEGLSGGFGCGELNWRSGLYMKLKNYVAESFGHRACRHHLLPLVCCTPY